MLWLYAHFPCLQLDTLAPDSQAPMAVVDERDNCIVQLNATAEKEGVRLGMGLATAAALCQSIQLWPWREAQAARRLEELAQGLYDLCGDISLDSPRGIWLGAARMVKYHNGFDNYCNEIRCFLRQQSLTVRLAAGHSPLAARLLARTGSPVTDDVPALKTACGQCPLDATDLSPEVREHLQRLGLRTLEQLLSLPLKDISRRFDADLAEYLGRLTGQLPHPLPFFQPPEMFRRHRDLPHELTTSDRLLPWVQRLLEELEAFLRRRERVIKRLELQLYPREAPVLTLPIGSARGDYRAERWLPLVALTLERQPLTAPVTALAVSARELLPRQTEGRDFLENPGKETMAPEQLVAQLQARLGEERVRGLAVREDFRPAKASGDKPPPGSQCPATRVYSASPATRAPGEPSPPELRPSWLLPEPQPCHHPLEIVSGPERIATGWWDHQPQVRDYYVARNADGQWCWVFQEPRRRAWFLQGYFA